MDILLRGSSPHRHRIRPLATLLILAGCAFGSARLAAADAFTLNEQVFSVGYARIADVYLRPVDIGQLALDGLRNLSGIDPAIKIEREERFLRVSVDGTVTAELSTPGPNDASAWAAVTARAVDRARRASPGLREASPERIYQAVFDGVTADLDTFSRYASAQRANNERGQRDGYGGVGVTLDRHDDGYAVRDVTPRGPADRAGVRSGDLLVAVEGETAVSLDETALRERLRGPMGSAVTLLVTRGDNAEARKIWLRRERVIPNTVSFTLADHIGIVRLERFNASTAANLREALAAARRQLGHDATGFVLDLRGNPGGLLDQAVAVADLFISRGRIITTEGRHPDSRQRFEAAGDDVTDGLPLVVLVDGRSASSAEVVAAALQDSGRAVVVGATSYGKGSVQTVTRLPNDGELFLTWSRIFAPSGYTLHRQGVFPTVCTSGDAGDAAAVLDSLRQGRRPSAEQISRWRAAAPDDPAALAHLRDACSWREHDTALDIKVAKALLADQALYRQALFVISTSVAER
jgi:carboxyl-terminal processing protease